MKLIQKDLSEPYSIYTYRYFIHNWPKLCFLAMDEDRVIGAIVCKLDVHKQNSKRGYIAMLAVDENYRRRKIGSNLVLQSLRAMASEDADEVKFVLIFYVFLRTLENISSWNRSYLKQKLQTNQHFASMKIWDSFETNDFSDIT